MQQTGQAVCKLNLRCGQDDAQEAPGGESVSGPLATGLPQTLAALQHLLVLLFRRKVIVETEQKRPDRLPPMPVGSHGCLE